MADDNFNSPSIGIGRARELGNEANSGLEKNSLNSSNAEIGRDTGAGSGGDVPSNLTQNASIESDHGSDGGSGIGEGQAPLGDSSGVELGHIGAGENIGASGIHDVQSGVNEAGAIGRSLDDGDPYASGSSQTSGLVNGTGEGSSPNLGESVDKVQHDLEEAGKLGGSSSDLAKGLEGAGGASGLADVKGGLNAAQKIGENLDDGDPYEQGQSGENGGDTSGGGQSGVAEPQGGADGRNIARDAATKAAQVGRNTSGANHGAMGMAKSALMHTQAAGMNAGQLAASFAAKGAAGVVNGFGAAGGFVSGLTGGAITGFAAGSTAAAVGLSGLGLAGAAFFNNNDPSMLDASANCATNVAQQVSDLDNSSDGGGGGKAVGGVHPQQETDAAKKLYSVFSKFGLSKQATAGILGNMEVESAIDASRAQNMPATYGITDGEKQAAANPSTGIGLIQWTGPNNTALQDYAKKHGKNWWDLDLQAAHLIDNSTTYGHYVNEMKSMNFSSPRDAGTWWEKKEAPLSDASTGQRDDDAEYWYAQMANWQVDDSYASGVISSVGSDSAVGQAADGTTSAASNGVSAALANCLTAQGPSGGANANNSSEASAAISYAYPFYKQSRDNDGTALYKEVHQKMWGSNSPDTNPLQSCDNGVSTAVRWSGTDDDYKEQAVANQLQYLEANPDKWQKIDWNGDFSKLQPGDVFINEHNGGSSTSHTAMWVGTDLPLKAYNNDKSKFEPGANMVSASHSEPYGQGEYSRSPGLGVASISEFGDYYIYRNIKKTQNSKYSSFKPSSSMNGSLGNGGGAAAAAGGTSSN